MRRRNLVIGGVVAVVVIAAIGAAAGDSNNEPAGSLATPTAEAAATHGQSPEASQAAVESPATAAPTEGYAVGDRIQLGDEEYLTVLEVDPAYEGTELFKPDADKVWVAALLEIEGINPDGATYNPFYFKAKDDEGFEYNFSAFGKEPQLQSSNDLRPGEKVKGWITFEVPKTVTALTLTYVPGILGEPVAVSLNLE